MEQWFVPEHMKQLAGSTVVNFRYDQQNTIEYTFDSNGFRNTNELTLDPHLFVIGNSLSFGIGVGVQDTYGSITANNIHIPLYNVSLGAFLHENHDCLPNIKKIASRDSDDIIVLQINNLGRQRIDSNKVVYSEDKPWCRARFFDYFDQVTEILKSKKVIFLYWDEEDYTLPKSITDQFLIYNKLHVDSSLSNRRTIGIKTNNIISKILTYKLSKI